MKYAIQVNSSPYAAQTGLDALHFIQAAIAAEHQVLRVFFYQEGAYHAFRYAAAPADEIQISASWSQLAAQHGIDLVVCISAAQRRGLLCSDEAGRIGKQDNDLGLGFRIAGLGQWLEAVVQADRCIVFA